ncbi:MAG: hypothetical protein ACRYFX_15830, partial [Janthinobacterium lividum]
MYVTSLTSSGCITPTVPAGCTNSNVNQQSYIVQKYVAIVNLPKAAAGYYAYWSLGSRNNVIANISGSGGADLTLYTAMAPASYVNHSPVFATDAISLICLNDTTTLLNNAVDVDGDRLSYAFGLPYNQSAPTTFVPPPAGITWNGGATVTAPLGPAPNSAKIGAATGITKLYATTSGNQYVIAVDVSEYRTVNGQEVLIGTTRRDVQLIVGICPLTAAPVIASTPSAPSGNYTVEAGSTLTFPITSTQADNDNLDMTLTSALLDGTGTGGYAATFNNNSGTPTFTGSPIGSVLVSGTGGTVTGSFVFTPTCDQYRATPYDVTVQVRDKGCSGKITVSVLHITVTKPAGPTSITGDAVVCGLNTNHTYTAVGAVAPNVSWRLSTSAGTYTGATLTYTTASQNPVQISWPAAGTYTLTARGVTQYGCFTDSITKTIDVFPAATLTVTPSSPTICPGGSSTITVAGAAPYTLSDGSGSNTQTGNGPFTVTPTQTTTYTVTGTSGGAGCAPTSQTTITVSPLPVANAGANVAICSGGTGQVGAPAGSGLTYSWSPTTGLSSATISNPTVTLTNTTSAATTTTYTLTVTNAAGCTNTGTVAVTVNPIPVAVPGVNVAFCSGGSASLGAAPVAGLTYSWSPATGLSSATAANPTVTLTNNTTAATTTTYTLTVTSASGTCTSTGTVTVTVNPGPTAVTGAPVAFCSGGSATLGGPAVAGFTYSWSPTTGLSSATAANPTVTLTNTTSAPVVQTYTLTVKDASGTCTGTGTVTVTVNPLPTAVAGPGIAICSGGSATLGSTPVAGYTYSWSPTTGLSSATSANPTVTLTNTTTAATTQTYTLTVTSAAGCTSTGMVMVTVNPVPTAMPGAAVSFCSGGSATLGSTPIAGYTYSWSPTTGLSSATSANPTVTLTNTTGAATTTTYTLTVKDASGTCTGTGTVAVTVNPLPTAVPGAAVTFCSGGSATLGGPAVAGLTYSWSPATGLSSTTAANPTVTLTNTTGAATTTTYTLTVTNTGGCTNTGTVAVTVNPIPTAVPGANVAICSGASATLGGPAVAGLTYSWSPATGLSSATVANPTVTLTNTTSAPITQTYTLTVTGATATCTSTGTVTVTVNPLPTAVPGAAVAFCSGGSATLGGPAVAGLTYSWSPATGLSSATAANPTVT